MSVSEGALCVIGHLAFSLRMDVGCRGRFKPILQQEALSICLHFLCGLERHDCRVQIPDTNYSSMLACCVGFLL